MEKWFDSEQLNDIISSYDVYLKGSYVSFKGEVHRRKLSLNKMTEFELYQKYNVTPRSDFEHRLFDDLKSEINSKNQALENERKQKYIHEASEADANLAGCDFKFNFDSTYILRPLNSDHDDIFLDTEKNATFTVKNQHKVFDYIKDFFDKYTHYRDWRKVHMRLVNVTFDPSQVNKFIPPKEGEMSGYFNLYKAPKWRYQDDLQAEPTEFLELMGHLFPEESEREVVFRWLHDATFFRAGTHLLLHGTKGTGKTTLARLALALVGEENSHTASSSQIDSNFDSSLANTVLYFWDELDFSAQRSKNKLKKYINTDFALEQKFKDSHEVSRIFASHIICNNSPEDCFLEVDDRVFTVPDITDVHLKKLWKPAKIKKFLEKSIKKDEFLAKIGFFLRNRYDSKGPVSSANTHVSDNYVSLINSTVKPFYKRAFVQLCSEQERFDINDVRMRCKEMTGNKTSVSVTQMKKFLNNYSSYLEVDLAKPYGNGGSFESLVYEGEASLRKDVMPFPTKEK